MTILAEVLHDAAELVDDVIDVIELFLVVGEAVELVDGAEQIDQLDHTTAEEIKLAEDGNRERA